MKIEKYGKTYELIHDEKDGYSIRTGSEKFYLAEIVAYGGTATHDIVAILKFSDDFEMQIVNYFYGASVTDIEKEFENIIDYIERS